MSMIFHPGFSGGNSFGLFEEAGMASVMIATECFCFSGGLSILLCNMNPGGIIGSQITASSVPLCLTSFYGFVRGSWG